MFKIINFTEKENVKSEQKAMKIHWDWSFTILEEGNMKSGCQSPVHKAFHMLL